MKEILASSLHARASGAAAFLFLLAILPARAEDPPRLLDEPPPSAQKEAEAALKDLLKAEYAAAKKGDGAQALAKKLLKYGGEEKSNAGQRYVCFREARDLAARGGDSKTALAAVDAMAASFKVDALEMKREALDAARRVLRSAAAFGAAAREYSPLIDGAVAADRYDLAARLAGDFLSAAEKAKLEPLVAEAGARKKDVRDIKAEFDRTAAERAAVAQKIDGGYRTLVSEVALADGDGRSAATPIVFRVVGDGQVLWTSKPLTRPKSPEKLKVRVSGIQTLRLEIDCPGSFVRAHAIWVEPQLIR